MEKKPIKKSAGKGKGLGKGLDSLIPAAKVKNVEVAETAEATESAKPAGSKVMINIDKVEPNREQPRKQFDEDKIAELADSIKKHGIFQPLLVQDRGDHYEIIAGERRWRAARSAGLKEVPVIIENFSEQEIVEISLIENIQREDLNAIEEAMAYKKLMTEFNMTQEMVSERVGKNRTTVANSIRLLNLTEEVQQMLIDGSITSGHARTLLTIENKEKQIEIARHVVDSKLSVREIEKLVKELNNPAKEKINKKPKPETLKIIYQDMENKLRASLGAKVNIVPKDNEKGKIEIEYYSQDELELLSDLIMKVKE